MAISLLFAGALLAQAGTATITVDADVRQIDVAYQELSQGQNEAAIAKLEGNRALRAGDPSTLINLGSAYARVGRKSEAQSQYLAAIASRDNYEVQLADGSWMNSRQAARTAAKRLHRNQILVLR